jgi:hypothetical protein
LENPFTVVFGKWQHLAAFTFDPSYFLWRAHPWGLPFCLFKSSSHYVKGMFSMSIFIQAFIIDLFGLEDLIKDSCQVIRTFEI